MIKKYIMKYAAYTAIFALFALAEKALGLYGVSVGFLFALLFCREKIYFVLPSYFLCETLIPFSVAGVIYAAGGAAVYAVAYIVHIKKNLRCGFLENALLAVLSLVPYIVFNVGASYVDIIRVLFSIAVSVVCGYASTLGLYAVLVRGLRYRPTSGEIFCLGFLVCLAGIGLGAAEPFGVKIFYFAAAFSVIFLAGDEKAAVLPFGVSLAIGGAIGSGEVQALCLIAVVSLIVAGTENLNSLFRSFVSCLVFCLGTLFFGAFDLFTVIPFVFGALAAGCIPKRLYRKISFSRQGYLGRYAMRTVVNRDRENVAERIKDVSAAFAEMRDVLCEEAGEGPGAETVTDSVCRSVCASCRFCARCTDRFDVRKEISKMSVLAAAEGRVGLLQVGTALGENCRNLNGLIAAINAGAEDYRALLKKRESAEQGREMIIAQMGGIAALLDGMADGVKIGLTFDEEKEKELTERLAQANIIVSDVMIYKEGGEVEVTVVVREKDAEKPALAAIVSHVLGRKMAPYTQKAEVGGTVGISFCRAPKYKIMYGESVYAKEERCGDTRRAVKIGKNKIMFILSDGMGTGKSAQTTAGNVIYLIETFYKAGFDHRTIFSSVAGMLALRTKEDFSALDVAVIDLVTGETDFIKQGGRESFVATANGFETVEGGTLPMGILADSIPKIERKTITVDDAVILMSDGIADALSREEIVAAACTAGLRNPKAVADEIVELAVRKNSDSRDDMTIMAFRLIEND